METRTSVGVGVCIDVPDDTHGFKSVNKCSGDVFVFVRARVHT